MPRVALYLLALLLFSTPAAALEIGDRAPDFQLPATTGGTVSLKDYLGKQLVLVEFYHTDWGPNCTANLVQRRNDHAAFEAAGVQVIGISLDHPFSQSAFAQSLGLPYPLLSDFPHGRTVRAWGIGHREGEAGRLHARPSFFLIDKAGIVRGYWGQRPAGPDEVLAPDPLVGSTPILRVARAISG
jgi:peroxiredoxin